MKHIILYEKWDSMNASDPNSPFVKNFGEFFPIGDLMKGDAVTYMGKKMYVIVPGEDTVVLHEDPNGESSTGKMVNQNMFTEKGAISKTEIKSLEGAPQKIKNPEDSRLTSLDGAPEKIGGWSQS
jgi:hypothetical protein